MIKKKSIVFFIISVLVTVILLFELAGVVLARDNYAIGIATIEDNGEFLWDSRASISEVITAYSRAGYRVYGVGNPGKQHLWEQLYADVQCFLCHGNQDCVVTAISGIVAGADRMYGSKDCIGTDSVHWDADTILVIYGSCQGAGNDGVINKNSVGYKTAVRGAQVVMAWRSSVGIDSLEKWTKNYNNRLADGYSVIQAMDYANSFSYSDSRLSENSTIIHHGDTSIKIGKYRSVVPDEVRPEDNLLLKARTRTMVSSNDMNQVYAIIKETYPQFNENNYIVTRGNAQSINVINGQDSKTEYINLKFKVGEFETESGFTVKAKDGIVEAIYDNTIDFNKETKVVNQRTPMVADCTETELQELKNEAIQKVLLAYNNNVNIDAENDVTHKYFYDIETGKKYVEFSIRSTMGTQDEEVEAYDVVKFEI